MSAKHLSVAIILALLLDGGFMSEAGAASDLQFDLSTNRLLLAEEIFGARAADAALGTVGMATITLTVLAGDATANERGVIIYRLGGTAQLGERDLSITAEVNDWSFSDSGDDGPPALLYEIRADGQVGDGGVTVGIQVPSSQPAMGVGDSITLLLPGLQNIQDLRGGDLVRVEMALGRIAGAGDSFPEVDPLVNGAGGHTITSDVLVEVVDEVRLRSDAPTRTMVPIDLSDRTRLAPGTTIIVDTTDALVPSVPLGTVTLVISDRPSTGPDGSTEFVLTEDDLLTFTITGNLGAFQAGALDLNRNGALDPGELINFSIGLPIAGDEAAIAQLQAGDVPVYLLLDEDDDEIMPSVHTVQMELDLAEDTYRDEEFETPMVRIFLPETAVNDDVQFELETTAWELAAELFGDPPARLNLSGAQTITLRAKAETGVSRGVAADIEYRLGNNLQWGRPLSAANLRFRPNPDNENSGAVLSLFSGGGAGDSEATFRLVTEAADDSGNPALAGGDLLILTLDSLQNLGNREDGDEVRVQVSVFPLSTTSAFNFRSLDPLTDGEDGSTILSDTLVRVRRQFTLDARGSGVMPTINVSNRTEFVEGATTINPSAANPIQGVNLGTLGITRAANRYQGADGVTDFALVSRDRLLIDVSGSNFHLNASAFLDLDGDLNLDTPETISLANGLSLSGTSSATRMFVSTSRSVYLVADGEAMLEPDTYTVRMTLDFANDGYRDASVTTPPITTTYHGIRRRAFAYALPNCTQLERGAVHIINETRQPLNIFVRAVDQSGREFGLQELDVSFLRGGGSEQLQPGESLDMETEHLELLFNLNDGSFEHSNRCSSVAQTWFGRAQLTFFANGNITILPRLRDTRGELYDLGGFSGLTLGDDPVR